MRVQRLLQTLAVTAAICAAQSTNGTNDLSNQQHQRLNGVPDPNTQGMAPTLQDFGSGMDQGNTGHFITMSDKQFATMLASRSILEIQLGKMATERGSSEAVKQLGREMVVEYMKWSAGMARASAGLGIKLPVELDAKHQATLDKISALSGPEFDTAYLKEMVTLQNKALTIAQYEAANAGVSGFRHWAGVMVPIIQSQLREAKQAMAGGAVAAK